jgi:FMN phosphatase YigB (HAD superfamily)
VEPGAIVHVGDNVAFDYDAPREAGMLAFYLDRSGTAQGDHIVHTLVDFEERLKGLEEKNTHKEGT